MRNENKKRLSRLYLNTLYLVKPIPWWYWYGGSRVENVDGFGPSSGENMAYWWQGKHIILLC